MMVTAAAQAGPATAGPMRGVNPALLTPMTADRRIDVTATRELCEFLIRAGVNGLYVCGSAGEAVLLAAEERERLLEIALEQAAGRIPVFAHVGAMPPETAARLAAHACAAGAGGIGAVTPWYYRLRREALKEYYRTICAAVPDSYPVYLYNLPHLTGNDLTPDLIVEIARENPNVVGVKNSMLDLVRLQYCLALDLPGFSVISGCDPLFVPGLLMGTAGCIASHANVIPEVFVAAYRAFLEGRFEEARDRQKEITAFDVLVKGGSDLAYLKSALTLRGLRRSYLRRPLLELDEKTESELLEALRACCPVLRSARS